jgi:hypothetical protein
MGGAYLLVVVCFDRYGVVVARTDITMYSLSEEYADQVPHLTYARRKTRCFEIHSVHHLITGGRDSLFHFTRLRTHSTASRTPVPVKALIGNTLLSLTP